MVTSSMIVPMQWLWYLEIKASKLVNDWEQGAGEGAGEEEV